MDKKELDYVKVLEGVSSYVAARITCLENIIRGTTSPCVLCIGCEKEDSRAHVCPGWIFSERQFEQLREGRNGYCG